MERKTKTGKSQGTNSVCVYFLDGTHLVVREQVSDAEAAQVFQEHTQGIGAMVGTTRKVTLVGENHIELWRWEYKKN